MFSRVLLRGFLAKRLFSSSAALRNETKKVSLTFRYEDGATQKVMGKVGDNLLDIVIDKDVDIDGFGACEGTLACSTCHLIFSQKDFDEMAEKPSDEELDMLDLAYGLTDTSRLGCQVEVTPKMEGIIIDVPGGIQDQR
ncbi:adrenodoxin-like protein 2, mitochondrial [Lepeophtheirus salmonis]|uniref:adrenodoxin-like protein 2, mitochondrial n=1 Tax=Lepeophtheirus salmonis TaxID=72036 RepID=UPI001AE18532|nr:adrenodoxin-like protein 2, mitochondrial [Lepeophtheirus salmonis]